MEEQHQHQHHHHHHHHQRPSGSESGIVEERRSILGVGRRFSGLVEAVSKLIETRQDPEEDPDFASRNPQWEEPLPSIHGVALPPDGKAQSTAALLAALDELPRHAPESAEQLNWRRAYRTVKKVLLMRRKAMRSAVGTGAQMDGHALGIWSPYSTARLKLFLYLYNQKAEYLVLCMILSHILVLIFLGSSKEQWTHSRKFDLELADATLTLFYTVEMTLRVLCLGFVKGPNTYLRNSYNRLDFVIVLDSWIHIVVKSITGREFFARIAILRAFRGLLVLKNFKFFADVIAIMSAVRRSIGPLQNVIFLTLFILVYFALIGVVFLEGTLNRRCLRTTDNQLAYPLRFCDESKLTHGFICPSSQSQKCLASKNPNWGSTNFDQFHYALLSMFQVISLEGWSLLMYYVKDSQGGQSDAYFMSLVVIGTYFLMNVFIAGISGVFLRVRAEHQMLLKKSRLPRQTTFYSTTVMANALREDIIKDDAKMSWYYRLRHRSKKFKRDIIRAASRTHSQMRAALSFKVEGDLGSRRFSRTYTRLISGGARASATLSDRARAIVEHSHFNTGVLLSVTINIIVLCLYKDGLPGHLLDTLHAIEVVLLICFSAEMVLRFLAHGPAAFVSDNMNLFDVFVITISAAVVICGAYPNVSSARVVRWFYLSKEYVDKNPSTVATCIKSTGSLVSVFFFYLLVLTVYSIISMELYSGQYYNFPDGYPRGNHDSMLQAMLLWFSVTTGESWVNQMWNSMRPGVKYNWLAPFLYILYYLMTTYVILNLIIAVILERSELNDNEKKQVQRLEHMKLIRRLQSRQFTRHGSWVVGAVEGAHARLKRLASRISSINSRTEGGNTRTNSRRSRKAKESSTCPVTAASLTAVSSVTEASVPGPERRTSAQLRRNRSRRATQAFQTSGFTQQMIDAKRGSRTVLENVVVKFADATTPRGRKNKSFYLSEYEELERITASIERPWYLHEGSLLLFGSNNVARVRCKAVVDSRWWCWFAIFWILVSILTVVEMKPGGEPLILKSVMPKLDAIVFGVFLLDVALKVVAEGLIFAPDAYMTDFFNLIDILVLIIDGFNLGYSSRCVHALLAFRPFRFICRFPGLKVLFYNLLTTMPAVASVLLFSFAIFSVFGSVGVQLFRGLFRSCNDLTIQHRAHCTGNFVNSNSLLVPRSWNNPVYHFDDFGNAFLTLFIASSFDSWVDNWLYPVMDTNLYNHQPRRNHSPAHAFYMVAFICVGGYFIVRVFVGVFINEFGVRSGSKLLTERQKLWKDMNRIIQKLKPIRVARPPKNRLRNLCHFFIHHRFYSPVMACVICSYCIFVATRVAHQSEQVTRTRQKAHALITVFFVFEMLAKMLGNEVAVYMQDHAALMEAVITISAAVNLMSKMGTPRNTIARIAYTSRLFCLIPHIPGARLLVNTLIVSLPIVAEIMALLTMCLFAFAGIGFQMFSQVKDGQCIGPWVNFRSFTNSFITVFQATTADNWSCILGDVIIRAPFCTEGTSFMTGDCGYSTAGITYFIVLIVIANYIFMNLFVAIILDAITFGLVNENSMITTKHLDEYRKLWSQPQYDSSGTGYIGMHKLRSFVNALGVPLGRRHKATSEWYARIEYEVMSFREPGKGIPFRHLLETLTLYKIGPTGLPLSLRIEREKQIQAIYRQGAATRVQAGVRGFLVKKILDTRKSSILLERKVPKERKERKEVTIKLDH